MQYLQDQLDRIVADMAQRAERGAVADYIPQLRAVDPSQFGIAVATADGQVTLAGNAQVLFSIQSVSKVFTLTLALGKFGDALWRRVGREPSGNPFNSISQLELEQGIPRNPFVNAGALVVTDHLLSGHEPREVIGELLQFMRFLADDDAIVVDHAVAASEQATGTRNIALANYIHSFGNLQNRPELVAGTYFHQCAIAMDCTQLAKAGLFLATGARSQGALGGVGRSGPSHCRNHADLRALRRFG